MNVSLQKSNNKQILHNKNGKDNPTADVHTGHFRIDATHIYNSIKLLSEEELQLAKQCNQLNMTNLNMVPFINISNVIGVENTWNR